MTFTSIRRVAVAFALLAAAGCTVKNSEPPPLTGPSGLALTINVNATPDSISQDGGSQSSVKITTIGPDGRGVSALPLRLDMFVNGVAQDYGTLSARSVITNSDGIATVVYTSPPSPVNGVFGTCSGLPGNCVSIVATPTSTNFATVNAEQVLIRLVPTGVILPPAGSPLASFTYSPTPPTEDIPLNFDASASSVGSGATSLTYAWTFGDGSTGTGKTPTHTYGSDGNYTVVLTVTNNRGLSASSSQQLAVTAATVAPSPSANFTFSPTNPIVFDTVVFDASSSSTTTGTSISRLDWNFGDSTPIISCPGTAQCNGTRIISHQYTSAGTFVVNVVVTDSAGHTGQHSASITVALPPPPAAPVADFTFGPSPASTGAGTTVTVNFTDTSTNPSGAAIISRTWSFGDGATCSNGGCAPSATNPSHVYTNNTAASTVNFNATLTIRDANNAQSSKTQTVAVVKP